ncbi:MAG: DUF1553 domain-containing protein [Planctomycetota bacterium]
MIAQVHSADADDEIVDFNRDIRPILSDKCFFCHGPDHATREAGLRLDVHEEAIGYLESGEVLSRIHAEETDLRMPPPESHLRLTDAEKQMLARWIDQGSPYAGHWAFERLPTFVDVPDGPRPNWSRQTLDHFVFAKMREKGLRPSAPADPLRWLRRVTLDLTGLPPTTEQILEFQVEVAEANELAHEHAVDRLLGSSAYGEHMAVAWLDAARYGDSYGYQSDKLNTQWPYRDWVVDSFNANLPYDQFLTWQIAGDLLDQPTRQQRLATAFNRIHRLNNEGGAVFEEWRLENVADRVHTFGTVVLGLTLECCRCHDHKYDPIPMRDYYSLAAYFNSIDESGVYDRTAKVPCPSMLLPTPKQERHLREARRRMQAAERDYALEVGRARQRFDSWNPSDETMSALSDQRIAIAFDADFRDSFKTIYRPTQSDRSSAPMPELVEVHDCAVARIDPNQADDQPTESELQGPRDVLTRRALKLDGERGVTTTGVTPFDRWMPFSVVVTVRETKRSGQRSLITHHTRGTDCGYNGWDLTIENGHLESRLARVWPGNGMSVRTLDPIPVDTWHQIAATYDGSSTAAGLKLHLNGEELRTVTLRDALKKSCNVQVDHGGEFVIGQRFRSRGLAGGLIDDVRVFERCLTRPELRSLATGQPVPRNAETFISASDPSARESFSALTSARKAFVMIEESIQEIPVMQETLKPRPSHVLARGQYDAPRNDSTRVTRRTLSGISVSVPDGAPNDRLGLARWVTHPEHPLTARVAVNRFWANFFTNPLVGTPENFGSQGELPSHPQLLDWLSRDFVRHGWDVKRLCKSIVLSATYRQDSRTTSVMQQMDPTNRWLARGPSHRLSAEQIRDLALAASGLLNPEMGGPPVSPYQPGQDLWKEANVMSPSYVQSVGESLHRRSLYSVWKRTAPLPNMMAFDTTTREVCSVKRSRTNTPLQALVLLNDVQFIEAARVLATDLMERKDADPIDEAMLRLTGRQPDVSEYQVLTQLFEDERQFYQADPAAAAELLALGDTTVSGGEANAELAALTNVCQVILNLDATIWKR